MKKLILLLSFLLSGCLFPSYYSHNQRIQFQVPEGSQAEYNGEQLNTSNNWVDLTVYRSWSDKNILIKKHGYQDYHLPLHSVWSDEKWAKWAPLMAKQEQKSGAFLMTPYNTFFVFGHTLEEPPIILCLPVALIVDVYNIVIGGPSTALINPWKKYEYDTNIQMTPLAHPLKNSI